MHILFDWLYILQENIDIAPLYFVAQGMSWIRFRTLSCCPQTGAVLSKAITREDSVVEIILSENSEREGRLLDKDQTGSMAKKKRKGYF